LTNTGAALRDRGSTSSTEVAAMQFALTRRELSDTAGSSDSLAQRAESMLDTLDRAFDFDSAWLALADPLTSSYACLASSALDEPTMKYLGGPDTARDIERMGANRTRTPMSSSDLAVPLDEIPSWADCLIPAGYREGLGMALFATDGRHVGYLALLWDSSAPPKQSTRRRLAGLGSVLGHGIDPVRSLQTAARLVQGATAGVVLRADRGTERLPGLEGHVLLTSHSPVVACARASIQAGNAYTTFLWPLGGRHAPDGHVRVTVFAGGDEAPTVPVGVVVLSGPPDCRGLTPREFEVLGLLIEGLGNQDIARVLVVAQRTVAAHVEHILDKLGTSTRTLAAVRAERAGLYVPVRHLAADS
jgi:DNA-binding CsgD family transcriptional regulator